MLVENGRWPDFLCIGTQKAGTTWLHQLLAVHPDFWMPPFKELDFWRPAPKALSRALGSYLQVFQHQAQSGSVELETLRWWAHFTLDLHRDAVWYRGLFGQAGARLSGDVSPGYSLLDVAAAARIREQMPDARVIIMLREPVERSWSQLRMYQRLGWVRLDVGIEELRASMARYPVDAFSDYPKLLRTWEGAFGASRCLVVFHDDIERAPEATLARVCDFLGAAPPAPAVLQHARRRLNASPPSPMPIALRRELSLRYLPGLRELVGRFPEPVGHWIRDLEESVEAARARS